jgi:hypothetical protein
LVFSDRVLNILSVVLTCSFNVSNARGLDCRICWSGVGRCKFRNPSRRCLPKRPVYAYDSSCLPKRARIWLRIVGRYFAACQTISSASSMGTVDGSTQPVLDILRHRMKVIRRILSAVGNIRKSIPRCDAKKPGDGKHRSVFHRRSQHSQAKGQPFYAQGNLLLRERTQGETCT